MSENVRRPTGLRARVRQWLLPGFDEGQKLLQQVARTHEKHTTALGALAKDVRSLQENTSAQTQSVRRISERLSGLHRTVRIQRESFRRGWRVGGLVAQHQLAVWRINERLARIAESDDPILVGPWTGEVGFELLYWIPFLNWATATYGLDRQRLHAVSRGGAGLWYRELTDHYTDVLEFFTPEQYRHETEFSKKQSQWKRFDTAILRQSLAKLHVKRAALLHPLMMYSALMPVWRQRVPYAALDELTAHRVFATPDLSGFAGQLPSRYIAVKFYASRQFPATPENKRFVARVITLLAKDHQIVVLGSGARLDEHEDFSFEYGERVHSIDHLLTPATNLDTQTRIIANATAFVGSYGGFSYLAPYFGVPAVSFYESRESFFDCHLDFARRVFTPPRGAGFVALDVRDAHLIESLLGGLRRDVELPVR